ncbi:hypothetical protein BDZ91DRAFT_716746 [Kalaharituber pfeilii]|nr:hypothetical protein BDZ91DRAFT_716746 [Kalaharituber pfeilii]
MPALTTPGGSLTAETAKGLAEFGGAVIRRGASAQINIALPHSRLRASSASIGSSSSTSQASTAPPAQSSHTSSPASAAPELDSGPASTPPSRHAPRGTPLAQMSPPEPAQPWKSLEVSLVDASLLRGFSPSLATPLPPPLPMMKPVNTDESTVPSPKIRSSTTLPVPPPQPMIHSISTHIDEFHQSRTSQGSYFMHQPHHTQHQRHHQGQYSPSSSYTHEPRGRPQPPPLVASHSQPDTHSHTHTHTHTHSHSRPHSLSRKHGAMSPTVIYRPPLQLTEISLPYKVQYHILNLLLATLEFVFFDFSSKWFPEILHSNLWDCPEAADVSTWSKTILEALNSASGEVHVSGSANGDSSSSGSGTPTRTRASMKPPPHAVAHLTSLMKNVGELQQDVTRRKFVSGEKLLGHLDNSVRVASLLGCNSRATELEETTYYVKEALGGIGIVREAVRGSLNERMEMINKRREELLRMEQDARNEASRLEKEECMKLGWDLATTLEPRLTLRTEWGMPVRPGRERRRWKAWNEGDVEGGLEQEYLDEILGAYSPPPSPHKGLRRESGPQGSLDRNRKGKGKAVDPEVSTPLDIDRGRQREPRISITSGNNPNTSISFSSFSNSSTNNRTSTASTLLNDTPSIPPAIPAKAAKRLSNLYPPTSPISDYDTDVEHEREGPGGVGLELTLSQASFGQQQQQQSMASSVTKHRNESICGNSRAAGGAVAGAGIPRPVTPAQVNMVREPVPQAPPIPISRLIEAEEIQPASGSALGTRRNSSVKSVVNISSCTSASTSTPTLPSQSASNPAQPGDQSRGTPAREERERERKKRNSMPPSIGPTPPLTPKERRITIAVPAAGTPGGGEMERYFDGARGTGEAVAAA